MCSLGTGRPPTIFPGRHAAEWVEIRTDDIGITSCPGKLRSLACAGVPTHRHTVLLVDAYPAARKSLQTLIEANGFAAVGAPSGGEALAQLRSGLACCLIVLDWWLPDMTGGDFIRALHATPALADIPVATCTDDARMRAEAATLGVTYVLLKPVDPRRLVTLVSHHCPHAPSGPAASN
jgi:two-component system, chemotaxis family, chemotaxis protein CheY